MAIQKSRPFMAQWREYAQGYKNSAGLAVAERFIDAVEVALQFIEKNHPYACALYDPGQGFEDLQVHQFRKWNLNGFPHLVLFRLKDTGIFIETLYAHRMDIPSRLAREL